MKDLDCVGLGRDSKNIESRSTKEMSFQVTIHDEWRKEQRDIRRASGPAENGAEEVTTGLKDMCCKRNRSKSSKRIWVEEH